MLIFYTVNPEPEKEPKAYIVRIFKEQDNETRCIQTVAFTICNPPFGGREWKEANEYGRLRVSKLMAEVLDDEDYE